MKRAAILTILVVVAIFLLITGTNPVVQFSTNGWTSSVDSGAKKVRASSKNTGVRDMRGAPQPPQLRAGELSLMMKTSPATERTTPVRAQEKMPSKTSTRTIHKASAVVLFASSSKSNTVNWHTINGLGVVRQSMLDAIGKSSAAATAGGTHATVADNQVGDEDFGYYYPTIQENGNDDEEGGAPYGKTKPHHTAFSASSPASGSGKVPTTIAFNSKTDPKKRIHLEFVLLVTQDLQLSPEFVKYVHHKLGFNIRFAETPVHEADIRNKRIADEVTRDGAMGVNEMIKVEALRFKKFNSVVMLDADIMFHKRFDELFDLEQTLGFTHGGWAIERLNGGFLVFSPNAKTELFNVVCGDAATDAAKQKFCPTSLSPAPSSDGDIHYHQLVELLREGDFRSGTAWKGCGIGWTYGGRTIQGVLPYYFIVAVDVLLAEAKKIGTEAVVDAKALHKKLCAEAKLTKDIEEPTTLITTPHNNESPFYRELSRCQYNNMAQLKKCKAIPFEDITSNHFTGPCMKPWQCIGSAIPLCQKFQKKWYTHYQNLAKDVFGVSNKKGPNNKDAGGSAFDELVSSVTESIVGSGGKGLKKYGGCMGGSLGNLALDWTTANKRT